MTVTEILSELGPYTGKFPMAAMQAAIQQREAIIPELVRVMEDVAAHGEEYARRRDCMLHAFATYLLAQFRERRLFRPLVTIVSLPGELPFDLYGDTITEALSRILGTVYDRDPAPLYGLVEQENINEFVRSAALDSFLVLERSGQMPREDVISYFRSLFHGRLKRTFSYAWTGLVTACADLPAPELLDEIRQAFGEGLVDGWSGDLLQIERDLRIPAEEQEDWRREKYSLITDAVNEMEWWASFHPEPKPRPAKKAIAPPVRPAHPASPTDSETLKRAAPRVGRNDPCPCGSGRKYKKCCLNKP